jgi:hypothetical protein
MACSGTALLFPVVEEKSWLAKIMAQNRDNSNEITCILRELKQFKWKENGTKIMLIKEKLTIRKGKCMVLDCDQMAPVTDRRTYYSLLPKLALPLRFGGRTRNSEVAYRKMHKEGQRQTLLTSWFVLALLTITIVMDRVVCVLLRKAKAVI